MTDPRTPASAPADGPQPAALVDNLTPPTFTFPPLVSGPLVLDLPVAIIARRKHGERRGCRKQRYTVTTRRVEITNDDLVTAAVWLIRD
jgi:hypothetical protein